MKQEEKYSRHYFKRFYFEIGSRFDGYEVFEIRNEEKYFELKYSHKSKSGSLRNVIIIKSIEFVNILMKLKNLNIEEWNSEYSNKLVTGNVWKLKIYYKPSIVLEKSGSNSFPENFNEVVLLVKTYFPDFIANTNIKTTLNEKDLFKLYCPNHRGTSFYEVSVGEINLSENSSDRRIDIVRIKNDNYKWVRKYSEYKELFHSIVNDYEIEIVEIKTRLNRGVIGQIIVGEYLFKKKYNVNEVTKTILYHIGDKLLENFCRENRIELIQY